MPLLLYRIYAVTAALSYMFMRIFDFLFTCLFRRKEADKWIDPHIQMFSRFCMKVLRADLTIEDQANLAKVDWTRPVFVMGNHNSYSDIPVAFLAVERTFGFIAKAELKYVPFLGFWMRRVGCIFVNREKRSSARRVREAVRENLKKSPLIFIFPEGTRGTSGDLGPFKSGGFRFAEDADATILPLAMKGTRDAWENRKSSAPCKISVKVLEPVDVKKLKAECKGEFDAKKDLMPMVRAMIEENL